MSFDSFDALEAQLNQLVQNNQYAEALDLVTREGPNFSADRIWVDFWHMCTAAGTGNHELVFQVAEQLLADGLWYGEAMWRRLPSFQTIQSDPNFERIAAAHRAAEERDAPADERILLTRLPENHSSTSPLLVALHGNNSTASQTLPFWQAAVSQGWVLALPQSTQVWYKGDAYFWDDFEMARATVTAHFARLQQDIAFEPSRVILAGHSMGGLVAIRLALMGTPNVRGFVAIGPAVPFLDAPEELEALLIPARQRGVRGYFLLGEQDHAIFADKVQALSERLQLAGITCELETVPDATHDYSPIYDAALLRALAFMDVSR
jgi:pimeloyl-ACP methyl ester carboxylesterase